MREKQRKWKKIIRIVLSGILIAACILATVLFAMTRNGKSMEDIKGSVVSLFKEAAKTETFYYDQGRNGVFADVGGSFLIASTTGVQMFGQDGTELVFKSSVMTNPAVDTCGDYAVAFDIGGTRVYVLSKSELIYSVTTEEKIIDAAVNANGWITLCTQEEGYNGQVTVYNREGTAVYQWFSGENFLLAAALANSNGRMAVLTIGQEASRITVFDLNSEEPRASIDISREVLIDLAFKSGDTLAAISTDHVYFLNVNGEVTAQYDSEGAVLTAYDLGGDGIVTAAYSDYKDSASGRIVTVNLKGEVLGRLDLEESIQSLAVNDRYVAALYGSGLVVYSVKLDEKASNSELTGGRTVLLREGKTAVVAGDYSAEIFDF